MSLLNSGLDTPHGADLVPQIPGQGGPFRREGARRALQAVHGPRRQGSEQDTKRSRKSSEAGVEEDPDHGSLAIVWLVHIWLVSRTCDVMWACGGWLVYCGLVTWCG